MPYFSNRSMQKLFTCDERLQRIAIEVIKYLDITITDGHRSREDQERAYHAGLSKLQYPKSKHNKVPSLAMDCVPYPINYDQPEAFYYMAGYIQAVANKMDIPIRWGGDWDKDHDFYDQHFIDLPHFELIDD